MSNAMRKGYRTMIRRACERKKMSNAGYQAGYNYKRLTGKIKDDDGKRKEGSK